MRRVFLGCVLLLLPSFAFAGGKAGVGNGLFWGTPLIGFGAELDIGKYLSVLGGVGVGTSRSPWSLGARISLAPPDRKWRPHLTGIRWIEGYGVYAGVDHDVGKPDRWVMTYGVGYGDVQLEGKIGAAIGIGYRFDFK